MVHNLADDKRREIEQIIQYIMRKETNGGYGNRTKKNGTWIVRWVAPAAGIFFLTLATTGIWIYSSLNAVLAENAGERLSKIEAKEAGFKEAIRGIRNDQDRMQRAIESLMNKHIVVSVTDN